MVWCQTISLLEWLFRSGSLVVTLLMGYFFLKKSYSSYQVWRAPYFLNETLFEIISLIILFTSPQDFKCDDCNNRSAYQHVDFSTCLRGVQGHQIDLSNVLIFVFNNVLSCHVVHRIYLPDNLDANAWGDGRVHTTSDLADWYGGCLLYVLKVPTKVFALSIVIALKIWTQSKK